MKHNQRPRFISLAGNTIGVDRMVIRKGLSKIHVMNTYPSCANGVSTDEEKELAISEITGTGINPIDANEMVRLVMTPEMMAKEVANLKAAIEMIKQKAKQKES